MSGEGFYSVVFQGGSGWGAGMVVLDTQTIVGADPFGRRYNGTYVYNQSNNTLEMDVQVTLPPGGLSVTGHVGSAAPVTFGFKASIPRGALTNHQHTVTFPDGRHLTFAMTKLRDMP